MQKDWMTVSGWLFGVVIPLAVGAKKIMRWIKQRVHRSTQEYARGTEERKQIIRGTADRDLAKERINSEYPFDRSETRDFRPKRGMF
ncbi:MAG: hypothetical protein WCG03_05740 [Kiritimatiellales bacterium]